MLLVQRDRVAPQRRGPESLFLVRSHSRVVAMCPLFEQHPALLSRSRLQCPSRQLHFLYLAEHNVANDRSAWDRACGASLRHP